MVVQLDWVKNTWRIDKAFLFGELAYESVDGVETIPSM
jgi:hypothetical protein